MELYLNASTMPGSCKQGKVTRQLGYTPASGPMVRVLFRDDAGWVGGRQPESRDWRGGFSTWGNRSVSTRPDLRRHRSATVRLLLWLQGSWFPAPRMARRYSNQDGAVAVCNHSELFRGSPALAGMARHRSGKISCRVHVRVLPAVAALEVQVVAPAPDQFHRMSLSLFHGPLLPWCGTLCRQSRHSA